VTIVGSRRQTRKIDMIKLTDDELMAFERLIAKSRPGAVALTTGRAGVILEALSVANTTPQRPFNLVHYLLARDAMNGQAAGSFAPAEGGEK
jgi:hypothetical protein